MVNTNWPTMVVEIEFTSDTWTDVTSRCQGLNGKRGRQYELAQPSAGTMKFLMDNSDGAFDPTNTGSAFYPNVKLFKRIRVKATWSSTTTVLWTGFIERYPTDWVVDGGHYQMTPITAVDTIGALNQVVMVRAYDHLLGSYNPVRWWPLNDRDDLGTYHCRVTGLPAREIHYGGQSRVGASESPIQGDEFDSVPFFQPNRPGAPKSGDPTTNFSSIRLTWGPNADIPTGTTWSLMLSLFVPPDFTQVGNCVVMNLSHGLGSDQYIQIRALDILDNSVQFHLNDFNGNSITVDTNRSVLDGFPHTIYFEMNSAQTVWRWSFDGSTPVSQSADNFNFDSIALDGQIQLGAVWPPDDSTHEGSYRGYVSNVVLFDRALTDTEITDAANMANGGGITELTGDRLTRLMDAAGRISLLKTPVDVGVTNFGTSEFAGKSAANALARLATTEGGVVWVNGDGEIDFAGRHYRLKNSTATINLGTGSGTTYPVSDLHLDLDSSRLLNDVTITRNRGGRMRSTSATSIALYGVWATTRTTLVALDNEALSKAMFLVSTYSEPDTRVQKVSIDMASNPTAFVLLSTLDINSCVRVEHTPLAGTNFSQVCWVESVEYIVKPNEFRMNLELSPAVVEDWLQVDDSTLGKIGATANNKLAY